MLWLSKPLVSTVTQLLSQAPTGVVATSDASRVHKALAGRGTELCEWSQAATDLAAVVLGGQGEVEAVRESLAPGGMLLWIDKGDAREASRRLLCAGFTDVSQARVGRHLVSSGRRA